MGQMQRRNRLIREVTGLARFKVIFQGAARATIADLEAATVPPQSTLDMVNEMAANGVTFWYDVQEEIIKASLHPQHLAEGC